MSEDDEPLLTGSEVETILSISPTTRRRWDASGKLPSVRLSNGMRRYRPRVIRELISQSETASVE